MEKLTDPKRYQRQIKKLQKALLETGELYDLDQEEVQFFNFSFDSGKISKLIAKTVQSDHYQFTPVVEQPDGNPKYCITDRIVRGVISEWLLELCEKNIPCQVKNKASFQNMLLLAKQCESFLKNHFAKSAAPSGIFIWQGKLADCPECISVKDSSVLWEYLRALTDEIQTMPSVSWELLQAAIRPIFLTAESAPYQTIKFSNQNPALKAAIVRIYLQIFDRYLAAIPNAFYIRCGTEFLLLHPDLNALKESVSHATAILHELKLSLVEKRTKLNYFSNQHQTQNQLNGVGFCNSFRLGDLWINSNGTIGIERKLATKFLKTLFQRALATQELLGKVRQSELGRTLCLVLNANMDNAEKLADPALRKILTISNSYQLNQFDEKILDIVVQLVTGEPVKIARKQLPFWKVRKQWHLRSLFDLPR